MELVVAEIKTKPVKSWEEIVEDLNLPKPISGNNGPDGLYMIWGNPITGNELLEEYNHAIELLEESPEIQAFKECAYSNPEIPDINELILRPNPNIPIKICVYRDEVTLDGKQFTGKGEAHFYSGPGHSLNVENLYYYMSHHYKDIFNQDFYSLQSFIDDLSLGATLYNGKYLAQGEVLKFSFSDGFVRFGHEDLNTLSDGVNKMRVEHFLQYIVDSIENTSSIGLDFTYTQGNMPRADIYEQNQEVFGAICGGSLGIVGVIALWLAAQRAAEFLKSKSQPSGDAS